MGRSRKPLTGQPVRGFESHPLRQTLLLGSASGRHASLAPCGARAGGLRRLGHWGSGLSLRAPRKGRQGGVGPPNATPPPAGGPSLRRGARAGAGGGGAAARGVGGGRAAEGGGWAGRRADRGWLDGGAWGGLSYWFRSELGDQPFQFSVFHLLSRW